MKLFDGSSSFSDHPHQNVLGERAARLPFVERVGVMGKEEGALGLIAVTFKHHRRGKAAQDRGDGARGEPLEAEAL